jgi:hypothetical protein
MLNNWLTPVSDKNVSSYFSKTFHSKKDFPNLEDAKIAIFTTDHEFGDLLRKKLNLLYNHFSTLIVDIGTLNVNNNSSIYQVISELQDGFIIPVLVGVDQNSFLEFCKAMSLENKLEIAAHVSNGAIIPQDGFAIENLAYQRHMIPKFMIEEINDSLTPGLSLGALRANKKILEPILREVNYLHFDLAAFKHSDCPTKLNVLPTGLYAEEACQIMRYIGEGLRLKLITFDTCDLRSESEVEAMLIAELIWYLHEGIELKSIDHPTLSEDFKEFVIEMNEIDHSLIFLQSNKSGKWWLQKEKSSNKYISCAYEEYEQSINNDIPDRLLKLL